MLKLICDIHYDISLIKKNIQSRNIGLYTFPT